MGAIPHFPKQPFCPDFDVQPMSRGNQVLEEGFVFFFVCQIGQRLNNSLYYGRSGLPCKPPATGMSALLKKNALGMFLS